MQDTLFERLDIVEKLLSFKLDEAKISERVFDEVRLEHGLQAKYTNTVSKEMAAYLLRKKGELPALKTKKVKVEKTIPVAANLYLTPNPDTMQDILFEGLQDADEIAFQHVTDEDWVKIIENNARKTGLTSKQIEWQLKGIIDLRTKFLSVKHKNNPAEPLIFLKDVLLNPTDKENILNILINERIVNDDYKTILTKRNKSKLQAAIKAFVDNPGKNFFNTSNMTELLNAFCNEIEEPLLKKLALIQT